MSRDARLARFVAAHGPGKLLFVANAWDVSSALVLAEAGAEAIATSSAANAWAAGFPDGEALPAAELLEQVRRMARAVDVPLSVDFERGYSDDPQEVAALAARLAEAGAVGLNLEDRCAEPEILARKIAAVRDAHAPRLFVSARTDLVLHGPPGAAVPREEILRRAALYEAAGADALFVPGLVDLADIRAIAAGTRLPLHVFANAALPPVPALAAANVRRISMGPRLFEVALTGARRAFLDIRDHGRWSALANLDVTFRTMQLLTKYPVGPAS